jgi:hypothetical protein
MNAKIHKVKTRKVAELIPYARNARTHSETQIAQIAASIKEFGFTSPIVIDEEGGVLAGHGRLLALYKLGVSKVSCVEASGLTDAQRKAYILADNKIAGNSEWDEEMLKVELEELKDLDIDMDLLGWGDSLPEFASPVDYGLLDSEDTKGLTDPLERGAKKAIMVEFDPSDYEEARSLCNGAREKNEGYLGGVVLALLRFWEVNNGRLSYGSGD